MQLKVKYWEFTKLKLRSNSSAQHWHGWNHWKTNLTVCMGYLYSFTIWLQFIAHQLSGTICIHSAVLVAWSWYLSSKDPSGRFLVVLLAFNKEETLCQKLWIYMYIDDISSLREFCQISMGEGSKSFSGRSLIAWQRGWKKNLHVL